MEIYNHKEIEKKWQEKWEKDKVYKTKEEGDKKFYILDMFPYPSGEGLHVGHPKGYIATDVYSRVKSMQSYDVLHPMGFDAFGLPAEQYAIKNKINPKIATLKNVERYKNQLKILGLNYDWEREINTTDPEFYKWTQWMWKQMYKKGLVYESYDPINWCPSCKTGLANEDLENGLCERCGSEVEKKPIRQWTIRITNYADRLLKDLDKLNWEPHIKELQRNWIGKSEGVTLSFKIKDFDLQKSISIFTTRIDTIFGATFLAISYDLAEKWIDSGWDAREDIKNAIKEIKEENKKNVFSFKEVFEKKGINTGLFAINPANKKEIPIYIANYILAGYGTGAIMAVPAHDERDYDFAKKYSISINRVIKSKDDENEILPFLDFGILLNSDMYDGLSTDEAKEKLTNDLQCEKTSTYKLKDWVFARQRYWGEPFPVVFDEDHNSYVVSDNELPIILPPVDEYEPTGTGESPLANIKEWVDVYGYINENNEFVSLEKDDSRAKLFKRETNTMPQWAGSSWYYLRYIDPHNNLSFVDPLKEKKWSPVDFYVGGAEHATRHLIYARFWHKFLFDIGVVSCDEPFMKLQTVGLIMAEDGRKMSKRWGNVVNPDDVINEYGADTLRLYEMFMGPFDQAISWNTKSMMGVSRFLDRVWKLQDKIKEIEINKDVEILLNKTIKKVTEDIDCFKFNTAISSMMILLNVIEKEEFISKKLFEIYCVLLSPFTPHMMEEVWFNLGHKNSIYKEIWPMYDESKTKDERVTLAIQISGKLRGTIEVDVDTSDDELKNLILETEAYKKYVNGEPKKIIIIKNKVVNIVI